MGVNAREIRPKRGTAMLGALFHVKHRAKAAAKDACTNVPAFARPDRPPSGTSAIYEAQSASTGFAFPLRVRTTRDPQPPSCRLRAAWNFGHPRVFSARVHASRGSPPARPTRLARPARLARLHTLRLANPTAACLSFASLHFASLALRRIPRSHASRLLKLRFCELYAPARPRVHPSCALRALRARASRFGEPRASRSLRARIPRPAYASRPSPASPHSCSSPQQYTCSTNYII